MGKGRHFLNKSKVLDYLVGGYDLAWIQSFESGNPFGFSLANSPNNYYPSAIGKPGSQPDLQWRVHGLNSGWVI